MGHSDIGVTLNTYTHIGYDDAKEELERVEKLSSKMAWFPSIYYFFYYFWGQRYANLDYNMPRTKG